MNSFVSRALLVLATLALAAAAAPASARDIAGSRFSDFEPVHVGQSEAARPVGGPVDGPIQGVDGGTSGTGQVSGPVSLGHDLGDFPSAVDLRLGWFDLWASYFSQRHDR